MKITMRPRHLLLAASLLAASCASPGTHDRPTVDPSAEDRPDLVDPGALREKTAGPPPDVARAEPAPKESAKRVEAERPPEPARIAEEKTTPKRTATKPAGKTTNVVDSTNRPSAEGGAAETPQETIVREKPPETTPSSVIAPFSLVFEPAAGGPRVTVPVNVTDLGSASDLSVPIMLAGAPCSLGRFDPSVKVEDRFVPAPPDSPRVPALRLTLQAGPRRTEQWLVPGSRTHGRLFNRAAIVDYLPELPPQKRKEAEDFYFKLYDHTPKIMVELKRSGTRSTFPVKAGERFDLEDPAYSVEVLRLVNCFTLDPRTKTVVDRSTKPVNPAVNVRIRQGGETRTAWLFSQLPEFSQGAEDEEARLRFVWPVKDHPHPRSEIILFDGSDGSIRVVVLVKGEIQLLQVDRKGSIHVPGLSVHVEERIPAATIEQEATHQPGGRPAVLLRWPAGGSQTERWIPEGTAQEVRIGSTVFTAQFLPKGQAGHGAR